MGTPPVPLARPRRGYQPTQPSKEQNPPQSVSGVIPWDGRVTTQEAADALISTFGGSNLSYGTQINFTHTISTPQEVGCVSYEEL